MARDDEAKPELPRTLGGRYKPRWKDAPSGSPDDAKPSLVARDTIVDRELDLERVVFGPERASERDALVSELKARTTVLSPALVAVHDAGEWDDDAFVALEQVEAGRTIDDALTAYPSIAERLRWAKALAEAAVAVDEAGVSLTRDDWAATVIDAYGLPRVRGLERATSATSETRDATLRALAEIFGRISPERASDLVEREALNVLGAASHRARLGRGTLKDLRDRIAPLVGPPDAERPLLPNVDPESLRRRQAVLLVVGLTFFMLSFVVLVVVLVSSR